jgi:hypothetical protein
MAIDNQFGKGIGLAAGFDLGAQKPLDSRIAVNTIEERDAHITENRAYEGMLVFVDADKITYQLLNGEWVVFFDKSANDESAEDQTSKNEEQDNRLQALEQKVGKDIDGENPAEGLFAEVDEAKAAAAQAAQAAANEESRAMGVEAGLQGAIDAINHAETGILAVAKKYADDQDAAQQAQLNKDFESVDERLQALEAKHAGENSVENQIAAAQKAADDAQADVDALELIVGVEGKEAAEGQEAVQATGIFKKIDDVNAAIEGQMASDKAELDGKITKEVKDREDADKAINDEITNMKNASLEGSLAKQIADEVSRASGEEARIEGLVVANKNAIDVINGTGEGSIKKAVADLVDGAPETLDTLNELAAALRDDKDVLTAVETAFDNKLASQKDELQKEIDDSVKEVADELAKQMDAEQEGTLAKKIADEVKAREDADKDLDGRIASNKAFIDAQPAIDEAQNDRLKALEDANKEGGAVANAIKSAQDAADAAQNAADAAQGAADTLKGRLDDEGGLVDRIEANEAFVAAQPDIDKEQDRRLKELEDSNAEGGAVSEAIAAANAAAAAAQGAADKAQGEVDALEIIVGKDAADGEPASGLVARIAANEAFVANQPSIDKGQNDNIVDLQGRMSVVETFVNNHSDEERDQKIADNAAAIEAEVGKEGVQGNRDKAIATALEDYTDTVGMKAFVASVVASLSLELEDDKVLLKLGEGVEGVTMAEVDLDVATEADIDAIIAGLDEVAGE